MRTEPTIVMVAKAELLAEWAARINAEHEEGERHSWRGMEHFRCAGELLLKAKAKCKKGWVKWVEKNLKFSRMQAWRYMQLAERWDDVTSTLQLEKLWQILCGNEDEKTAHVSHNAGEHEWYTPPEYIEAARRVLGGIDLDPASSKIAQQTVRAGEFFTAKQDGLSKPWAGRVWLNPPYASELVGKFTGKLCEHVQAGDVTAALLLVNNATETTWFQQALRLSAAVCLPEQRVKFLDPDGEPGAPLQGQAVLYFGTDSKGFVTLFKEFGECLYGTASV